jgi:hypothetical protein
MGSVLTSSSLRCISARRPMMKFRVLDRVYIRPRRQWTQARNQGLCNPVKTRTSREVAGRALGKGRVRDMSHIEPSHQSSELQLKLSSLSTQDSYSGQCDVRKIVDYIQCLATESASSSSLSSSSSSVRSRLQVIFIKGYIHKYPTELATASPIHAHLWIAKPRSTAFHSSEASVSRVALHRGHGMSEVREGPDAGAENGTAASCGKARR